MLVKLKSGGQVTTIPGKLPAELGKWGAAGQLAALGEVARPAIPEMIGIAASSLPNTAFKIWDAIMAIGFEDGERESLGQALRSQSRRIFDFLFDQDQDPTPVLDWAMDLGEAGQELLVDALQRVDTQQEATAVLARRGVALEGLGERLWSRVGDLGPLSLSAWDWMNGAVRVFGRDAVERRLSEGVRDQSLPARAAWALSGWFEKRSPETLGLLRGYATEAFEREFRGRDTFESAFPDAVFLREARPAGHGLVQRLATDPTIPLASRLALIVAGPREGWAEAAGHVDALIETMAHHSREDEAWRSLHRIVLVLERLPRLEPHQIDALEALIPSFNGMPDAGEVRRPLRGLISRSRREPRQ